MCERTTLINNCDYTVLCNFSTQDLINWRTLEFTASIVFTPHSPTTGIMKITNPVTIIFNASGPEASPNIRLAIPVRAKMNARIPRTTPERLFRKIPIHWISVNASMIGMRMIFPISLSRNILCLLLRSSFLCVILQEILSVVFTAGFQSGRRIRIGRGSFLEIGYIPL